METPGRLDIQQLWNELQSIKKDLTTAKQLLYQLVQRNESPLGFVDNEFGQLIHCDGGIETGGFWYIFDERFNKRAIPYRALNGLVKGLRFLDVREGSRAYHAMELLILAHKPLVLRDTWNSTFSKSIVSALAGMQPKNLREPLTVDLSPDAEGKTFCFIRQNGRMQTPYSTATDANFKDLVRQAVQNVKEALPM
jgi:hypothetical protein